MPRTLGLTGVEAAERERARLRDNRWILSWQGDGMSIDNCSPMEAILYACGSFGIPLDCRRLEADRDYYEQIQAELSRRRKECLQPPDRKAEEARSRVLEFVRVARNNEHVVLEVWRQRALPLGTHVVMASIRLEDLQLAAVTYADPQPLPPGERLDRLRIVAEALLERDRGDPIVRGLCEAAGVSARKIDPVVTLEPGSRFLVHSPYMTKEQAAVAYVERIDVSHAPSYVASYIGETYHPRHDRVSMRVELRVEGVG